jgi:hypothetical protein
MPLNKGSVNPLNVVGQRRLTYIPPHFATITLSFDSLTHYREIEKFDQWIYSNLNSRYCVRIKQGLDAHRRIIDICEIGVEDPKELSMFGLACPYLHKKT